MENEPLIQNIDSNPSSPEQVPAEKPKKKKLLGLWIGLAVLVILVVLGFVFRDSLLPAPSQPAEVVEGAEIEIVAMVNGDSIDREIFNIRFGIISGIPATELDLESEANSQLKTQVIDDLVNSKLLLQAAIKSGVTLSAEEVETRLQQIIDQAGSQEALQAQLDQNGISFEFVRQELTEQGIIQKYIGQRTSTEDLSVTEEEIIEFYNTVSASDPTVLPLDEVRPQIESAIVNQKTNEAIDRYIQALRQEAEIEILF